MSKANPDHPIRSLQKGKEKETCHISFIKMNIDYVGYVIIHEIFRFTDIATQKMTKKSIKNLWKLPTN